MAWILRVLILLVSCACIHTGKPEPVRHVTDSSAGDDVTDSESDPVQPDQSTQKACQKRKHSEGDWQHEFKQPCACAQRRKDYNSCFTWFITTGLEEYSAWRAKWHQMHKQDQDRMVAWLWAFIRIFICSIRRNNFCLHILKHIIHFGPYQLD